MFPFLRATLFGLVVGLALVHTLEFLGPIQLFWFEGTPLDRVAHVHGSVIAYRFMMLASVLAALSALLIPPSFFIGKNRETDLGGAALFVSLAAALVGSALLAEVMTLYRAVLPLVSAAVKNKDLSFFGGDPGKLPLSIEQALLSVGRGAVFQQYHRYEALYTRQALVYLPITEALFGMASLVFFSRFRPGRTLELFFLAGAFALMCGAGLALYHLENDSLGAVEAGLCVAASRLGFLLMAGGLILGLDALRRIGPDGALGRALS